MDEDASRRPAEPLAGVRSPLVTDATRRVARKLRDTDADPEVTASLLAAIALSMDGRRPDVVSTLLPRPSPQLGHQLVDLLRGELLASWTNDPSRAAAPAILDAIARLEAVRPVLERNDGQQLATGLAGPDALDLFVEIVHDLRSPLAAVLFLADTLQRGQSGEVNPLQHRQLGLIYSAALGLSGLVSDALDLARGSDELGEGEPSPLSLGEVLNSVADIARPMAEDKGLLLRVIPAQPDSRLGHPVALNRVLLNLTTNALKFTEHGHVEIRCTARGTSRLEFSVRDTGPGINPEALEHLYQPFRPARERQGYCFSGTGLGLAITRKLVIAMGGELEYETSGVGTRFFFELDLPPA
ncbi:MAG TPA: HAMP domain-containing sensor histidine kinase [Gemmatimonadales bacterium]|nr:HAMP domain-containing sensor histidine kinase [Gemmatimonadales bacterium]